MEKIEEKGKVVIVLEKWPPHFYGGFIPPVVDKSSVEILEAEIIRRGLRGIPLN